MSTEQNKAVARQLIEDVISQGNINLADQLLKNDFIDHEELPPGTPPGVEGFKLLLGQLHSAFPDFKVTIHQLIAENDMVAVFMSWHGTQQGEFVGIPPSGNRISINVFDLFRLADGIIVEHWGMMDSMAMMQQLGAMPTS